MAPVVVPAPRKYVGEAGLKALREDDVEDDEEAEMGVPWGEP